MELAEVLKQSDIRRRNSVASVGPAPDGTTLSGSRYRSRAYYYNYG